MVNYNIDLKVRDVDSDLVIEYYRTLENIRYPVDKRGWDHESFRCHKIMNMNRESKRAAILLFSCYTKKFTNKWKIKKNSTALRKLLKADGDNAIMTRVLLFMLIDYDEPIGEDGML